MGLPGTINTVATKQMTSGVCESCKSPLYPHGVYISGLFIYFTLISFLNIHAQSVKQIIEGIFPTPHLWREPTCLVPLSPLSLQSCLCLIKWTELVFIPLHSAIATVSSKWFHLNLHPFTQGEQMNLPQGATVGFNTWRFLHLSHTWRSCKHLKTGKGRGFPSSPPAETTNLFAALEIVDARKKQEGVGDYSNQTV